MNRIQRQTQSVATALLPALVLPILSWSAIEPWPELTFPPHPVETYVSVPDGMTLTSSVEVKPQHSTGDSSKTTGSSTPPTPQESVVPKNQIQSAEASPKPEVNIELVPESTSKAYSSVSGPEALESYFHIYAEANNLSADLLRAISKCESGHNPAAQNGPYGGLFQFSASTWQSTRKAMGLDPDPALRYDAEQAINTAAWKIAHGGIGAWPVCGQRALAYVQ